MHTQFPSWTFVFLLTCFVHAAFILLSHSAGGLLLGVDLIQQILLDCIPSLSSYKPNTLLMVYSLFSLHQLFFIDNPCYSSLLQVESTWSHYVCLIYLICNSQFALLGCHSIHKYWVCGSLFYFETHHMHSSNRSSLMPVLVSLVYNWMGNHHPYIHKPMHSGLNS